MNSTAEPYSSKISGVSVAYSDYADEERYVIDGCEAIAIEVSADNSWDRTVSRYFHIKQSGELEGTRTGEGVSPAY